MADENQQQPNLGNLGSPPSNDDLVRQLAETISKHQEAERRAADAKRQYDGLQGTFQTERQKREEAEAQLSRLSQSYEGEKGTLKSERDQLAIQNQQFQSTQEELTRQLNEQAEKFEVLNLITTKYPSLAPEYAKGKLRTTGLKGDELNSFLETWAQDVAGQQRDERREQGQTPPPPPGGQNPMTYDEVLKEKVKALRQHGANSTEFKKYLALEEQMIKEGKHKPR